MMNQDPIQLRLRQWFMRKTPGGSVRQVAQLPLAVSSDIGNVRTENQDRVGVLRAQITPQRSFLVAVLCDGMGGMTDGAECASIAVATFLSSCIRNRDLDPTDRLKVAVENANTNVNSEYHEKGGATLSAFLIDSEGSFVAVNVGDSRVYSFSEKNKLQQLSEDDTLAGQLNHGGEASRLSNELLQFVGMGDDLEPHLIALPELDSISQLLLTSDGAHFVNRATLESVVQYSSEPTLAANRLIELSKWCGGKDNASVVVVNNLSSIFSMRDAAASTSGMVEVWDAYGDVQLIGIEKPDSPMALKKENGEQSNVRPEEDRLKCAEIKETVSTPNIDDKQKVKTKRKYKRKKSAKPKSKNEGTEDNTKIEKPQIKINFE